MSTANDSVTGAIITRGSPDQRSPRWSIVPQPQLVTIGIVDLLVSAGGVFAQHDLAVGVRFAQHDLVVVLAN